MAVQMKYPCKRFTTLARVGGVGFRSIARLDHSRSLYIDRVLAIYTRYSLPFDYWIGGGRPLNPYLRGIIVDLLRSEMRPKEFSLIPDDLFEVEPMKDFIEWSVLRSWVRSWLRYCQWYSSTALRPDVTIEEFFRAPIRERKWRVTKTDPQLIPFGLLWKVYDLVALKGLDFRLPILESVSVSPFGEMYLQGRRYGIPCNCSRACSSPSRERGHMSGGRKRSSDRPFLQDRQILSCLSHY